MKWLLADNVKLNNIKKVYYNEMPPPSIHSITNQPDFTAYTLIPSPQLISPFFIRDFFTRHSSLSSRFHFV